MQPVTATQPCDAHSKRPHLSVVKLLKNEVLQPTSESRRLLGRCFSSAEKEIMKDLFLAVKSTFQLLDFSHPDQSDQPGKRTAKKQTQRLFIT